jgi:hypothetical protein
MVDGVMTIAMSFQRKAWNGKAAAAVLPAKHEPRSPISFQASDDVIFSAWQSVFLHRLDLHTLFRVNKM